MFNKLYSISKSLCDSVSMDSIVYRLNCTVTCQTVIGSVCMCVWQSYNVASNKPIILHAKERAVYISMSVGQASTQLNSGGYPSCLIWLDPI